MSENNMDALKRGRLVYQEKIANGEIVRLNPTEKAKANPTSMRRAINANCYECNGQENWVTRTRECPTPTCPFYNFRPHK